MAAAEKLGGVDLILTSPPYPTARPGHYGGDAPADFTWADYQELGDLVARTLKPGGFCALNIDGPVRAWRGKSFGSERSLIAFRLALDWAERVGLRYVEHCAYVRPGIPGRFGPRWRSGWEPVHLFQRVGAEGFFDPKGYTLAALKPDRVQRKGRFRSASRSEHVYSGPQYRTGETKMLTTAFSTLPARRKCEQNGHPAVFASDFAEAYVRCYCPPGGLVCDPFVGSGTVAIAAAQSGRHFIGGDLGARVRDGVQWATIALERATSALPVTQPTAATAQGC